MRAFTAIAKAENFKAAVRQLRISQSALRVLMKDLEEDLSGRLLDRTTRKVRIFEVRQAFLSPVLRVMEDLERAIHSVGHAGSRGAGRVPYPLSRRGGAHRRVPNVGSRG